MNLRARQPARTWPEGQDADLAPAPRAGRSTRRCVWRLHVRAEARIAR